MTEPFPIWRSRCAAWLKAWWPLLCLAALLALYLLGVGLYQAVGRTSLADLALPEVSAAQVDRVEVRLTTPGIETVVEDPAAIRDLLALFQQIEVVPQLYHPGSYPHDLERTFSCSLTMGDQLSHFQIWDGKYLWLSLVKNDQHVHKKYHIDKDAPVTEIFDLLLDYGYLPDVTGLNEGGNYD